MIIQKLNKNIRIVMFVIALAYLVGYMGVRFKCNRVDYKKEKNLK